MVHQETIPSQPPQPQPALGQYQQPVPGQYQQPLQPVPGQYQQPPQPALSQYQQPPQPALGQYQQKLDRYVPEQQRYYPKPSAPSPPQPVENQYGHNGGNYGQNMTQPPTYSEESYQKPSGNLYPPTQDADMEISNLEHHYQEQSQKYFESRHRHEEPKVSQYEEPKASQYEERPSYDYYQHRPASPVESNASYGIEKSMKGMSLNDFVTYPSSDKHQHNYSPTNTNYQPTYPDTIEMEEYNEVCQTYGITLESLLDYKNRQIMVIINDRNSMKNSQFSQERRIEQIEETVKMIIDFNSVHNNFGVQVAYINEEQLDSNCIYKPNDFIKNISQNNWEGSNYVSIRINNILSEYYQKWNKDPNIMPLGVIYVTDSGFDKYDGIMFKDVVSNFAMVNEQERKEPRKITMGVFQVGRDEDTTSNLMSFDDVIKSRYKIKSDVFDCIYGIDTPLIDRVRWYMTGS